MMKPATLLAVLLFMHVTAARKQQKYRNCSDCIQAGRGWCPIRRKCGGFSNRVCRNDETDFAKPIVKVADSNLPEAVETAQKHIAVLFHQGAEEKIMEEWENVAVNLEDERELKHVALDCSQYKETCETLGMQRQGVRLFIVPATGSMEHVDAPGLGDAESFLKVTLKKLRGTFHPKITKLAGEIGRMLKKRHLQELSHNLSKERAMEEMHQAKNALQRMVAEQGPPFSPNRSVIMLMCPAVRRLCG